MKRRRRFPLFRVVILILAILTLGILVVRARGLLPLLQPSTPVAPTATPTSGPTFSAPVTEDTDTPRVESTQIPLAPGSETPADQWANTLLDRVLPLLQEGTPSSGDLAWWRSEGAAQELTWDGNQISIGGKPFPDGSGYRIDFSASDPERPNRLEPVGSVTPQTGALLLTIGKVSPQQTAERWVLSTGSPLLALQALAVQASARDLILWVTYTQEAGSVIQMVILEARSTDQPTSTSTAEDSSTVTLSASATASLMPTPTRAPDTYLGGIVAAKIDPAITDADQLSSLTTQTFLERHPWAGVLSSTEQGIQIGGRATAVDEANEVTFYMLQNTQQTSGGVSRLFAMLYTVDGTTRFSDEQILFQGHRLEEIMYWMVIHAAERGGQLIVAYDDFGQRQAVTIIGFKSFPAFTP